MLEKSDAHETLRLNGSGRSATRLDLTLDLIASVLLTSSNRVPSRQIYHRPSWHHLRKSLVGLVKSFLYALVPQIIRTHYFDDRLPAPRKPNSTTWMNGLRGLAALTVFNLHYMYAFQYDIVLGYWTHPDRPSWFYQIPPIPIIYDGANAVQMFLTIAGYVCSYTTLENATRQKHDTLFRTFPASVFRRFFRLYLPAMTSLFCISMLAYCGAYEPTRHYFDIPANRKVYFPGSMGEIHPRRFPTLTLQLGELWTEVHKMGNVWIEHNQGPILDDHLWTISAEFRGSMHLYIALLALARCKPHARIFWLLLLGYIEAFQWPHQECLPFFAGAVIAQMDVLRKQRGNTRDASEVPLSSKRSPNLPPMFWASMRTFAYIMALYFMCFPMKGWHHPSYLYGWLNAWIPSTYGRPNAIKFPKQIGCIILFYLLTTVPDEDRGRSIWHKMCTSKIAVYLGSIMFGIYLTHSMVLHLVGYCIPLWIWARIGGNEDTWRYLSGLFFAYVINLALCLWAADVWTREVEARLMGLIKWLEHLCFVE